MSLRFSVTAGTFPLAGYDADIVPVWNPSHAKNRGILCVRPCLPAFPCRFDEKRGEQ